MPIPSVPFKIFEHGQKYWTCSKHFGNTKKNYINVALVGSEASYTCGARRQRAAQVRRQRGAGCAPRARLRRAVAQLARVSGVLQQLRSWSRFLSQSHHRDDQARLEGSKTHEPPAPRLLRGVVVHCLHRLLAATCNDHYQWQWLH